MPSAVAEALSHRGLGEGLGARDSSKWSNHVDADLCEFFNGSARAQLTDEEIGELRNAMKSIEPQKHWLWQSSNNWQGRLQRPDGEHRRESFTGVRRTIGYDEKGDLFDLIDSWFENPHKQSDARWYGVTFWETKCVKKPVPVAELLNLQDELEKNHYGVRWDPASDTLLVLQGGEKHLATLPEELEIAEWPFRVTFSHTGQHWRDQRDLWLLLGRKKQEAQCEMPVFFTIFAKNLETSDAATKVYWERLCRPLVCEIYSPPRVVAHAKKMGLTPGWSIDLGTGWDLTDPKQEEALDRLLSRDKPELVVASPPCDPFSMLNHGLNYPKWDPSRVEANLQRGRRHLRVSVKVCVFQYNGKKYFLFEHPYAASSWDEEVMQELLDLPGVIFVRTDMCRWNLRVASSGKLSQKPTGILTNSPLIAVELDKRCQCAKNSHASLLGVGAKSGVYTKEFSQAILRGLRKQLLADGKLTEDLSTELAELYHMENFPDGLDAIPEDEEVVEQEADDLPDSPDVLGSMPTATAEARGEVVMEEPSREHQAILLRMHKNLGHPKLMDFLRALRVGGCKASIRLWVRKNFHCPECDAQRRPGVRRPATLPRSYAFNRVVGLDTVELPNWNRSSNEAWLNMLCWGVRYGQLDKTGDTPQAASTWASFQRTWLRHYGMPEVVVTDGGPEFKAEFANKTAQAGIFHHVTDAHAPWQNGPTERMNSVYREHLEMAMREFEPTNAEEHEQLVWEVVASRNRYTDRSGFSAVQRVYGQSQRLPHSLLADDFMDPGDIALGDRTDMQKAHEIRAAAMASMFKVDGKLKLMRAASARTRTRPELQRGEWVWIYRRNRLGQRWMDGPGVVIMNAGASVWVVVRTQLFKVPSENIRKATNDEKLGIEQVEHYLPDLREELTRRRRRREYWDLSREGEDRPAIPDAESTAAPASSADVLEDDSTVAAMSRQASQVQQQQQAPVEFPDNDVTQDPAEGTPSRTRSRSPPPSSARPPPEPTEAGFPGVPARVERIEERLHEQGAASSSSASGLGAILARESSNPAGYGPARPASTPRNTEYYHETMLSSVQSRFVDKQLRKFGKVAQKNFFENEGIEVTEANFEYRVNEDNVCAFYVENISSFLLIKAKKSDEISSAEITEEEWPEFRKALEKEANSMIQKNKAMTPLTMEESTAIWQEKSDRIVRSRCHLRRKPVDTATGMAFVPKARWIVLGFEDPDVFQLETTSPTPQLQSINIFLSVSAGLGQEVWQGDLEEAFLQGKRTNRELYIIPPQELLDILGLEDGQLLRMEKEVYGTVRGTASWRETIGTELQGLGYAQSLLDPCVYILVANEESEDPFGHLAKKVRDPFLDSEWLTPPVEYDKEESRQLNKFLETAGRMILLVDDVLESGNEKHREKVAALKQRFRFGKYKKLTDEGGGIFNGRRIRQGKLGGIKADMADYIHHKLKVIPLTAQRKKELRSAANEKEKSELRASLMTMMWIAREGRFDGLGAVSVLARRTKEPTVSDLIECNQVSDHFRATKDLGLMYYPVHPANACLVIFVDAALPEEGETHPQGGFIIGIAGPAMSEGQEAPINLVAARSGKIDRVCSSSLASESYAMIGGVSAGEWVQFCYMEMSNSRFTRDVLKQRLRSWDMSCPERPAELGPGILAAKASSDPLLMKTLGITDAKSLFDALQREARSREPRVSLAVSEIKQSMAIVAAQPRWIPHNVMLADSMTKGMPKANLTPLMQAMASGCYCMKSEVDEQKYRENVRASGQTIARLRGKKNKKEINQEASEQRQENFAYHDHYYEEPGSKGGSVTRTGG